VSVLGKCMDRKDAGWCQAATAVDVEVGCVHEHIWAGSLCKSHMRDTANGDTRCALCYDAGDYECTMRVLTSVPS